MRLCFYGRSSFKGGVVHSFDGSREDLESLLNFDGIYIGTVTPSLLSDSSLGSALFLDFYRSQQNEVCWLTSKINYQLQITSTQARDC